MNCQAITLVHNTAKGGNYPCYQRSRQADVSPARLSVCAINQQSGGALGKQLREVSGRCGKPLIIARSTAFHRTQTPKLHNRSAQLINGPGCEADWSSKIPIGVQ